MPDLAAIRTRLSRTTKGTWTGAGRTVLVKDSNLVIATSAAPADVDFIVHARDDLWALCNAVEVLPTEPVKKSDESLEMYAARVARDLEEALAEIDRVRVLVATIRASGDEDHAALIEKALRGG